MDYYPILRPAVVALNPNDPQTRAVLYNRARKLLADRAAASTVGNTALSKEFLALENAIQRIEEEFLEQQSPAKKSFASRMLQRFSRSWPRSEPPLQQEETVDLRPSGRGWKIAAAASALGIVVVAGGMGLSYWLNSKSRPARGTVESFPAPRMAEPLPDLAAGSDQRPYTLRRQLVYYRTTLPAGSIVISKSQKFLYLVRPNVVAMRYSIGIGNRCVDSVGLYLIASKEEFPGWDEPTPSGQSDLLTRTANPLGARALYLERDERRIHGISRAIGMGSSQSCFQLVNDDVIDLFERVPVGTRVVAGN